MNKRIIASSLLLLISLSNYLLVQLLANFTFPIKFYPWALSILWLVEVIILWATLLEGKNIFQFHPLKRPEIIKVLVWSCPILLGVIIFMITDIHNVFHKVSLPFVFIFVIPVVEEILFRGIIFEKLMEYSAQLALVGSSILFALHHLQYYSFHLSAFVVFQIFYTFLLGLCLGNIRKYSRSISLGIIMHIFINTVVLL